MVRDTLFKSECNFIFDDTLIYFIGPIYHSLIISNIKCNQKYKLKFDFVGKVPISSHSIFFISYHIVHVWVALPPTLLSILTYLGMGRITYTGMYPYHNHVNKKE